jgi:hypothetical protein
MVMAERRAVLDLDCGDIEESRIRIAGAFHGLSEMKESANDIRGGRVIILPTTGPAATDPARPADRPFVISG